MRLVLVLLALALPLLADDAADLKRAVADLASPKPEVVEAAERTLLIAGPVALPLLRADVEERLARAEALMPRIAELVRALDAEEFASRDAAERELVACGDVAIPALREAMASGSVEQKSRAEEAISQIESSQGARDLVRLAEAIGAQPDDGCVPVLLALAKRISSSETSPAIDGLQRLGTPAAHEALRQLATDGNLDRRWSAQAALMTLGETPPGPLLQFAHDRPSRPVRRRVAAALGIFESPDLVAATLAAWEREDDADLRNRLEAFLATCLDDAGLTRAALDALPNALPNCRCTLVSLLRSRSEESEKAIRGALADPDQWSRAAAATQAVRLLGDDARPLVAPLLADPEMSVRRAAIDALETVVGRDSQTFPPFLCDRDTCFAAVGPVLERAEGADAARAIPCRWGPYSAAEDEVLRHAALPPLLEASPLPDLWSIAPQVDRQGGAAVRDRALRLALAKLLPGSARAPQPPSSAELFREVLALPPEARLQRLRDLLRGVDPRAAIRIALLLDVDGLEEHVLPHLTGIGPQDPRAEDLAREYMLPRKTDALVSRVRKMAKSPASRAATLWVGWEGRPAAEALLDRLKGGESWPEGILEALAGAPLRPEDAPVLLAGPTRRAPPPAEEAGFWFAALVRTGAPEAIRRVADALLCREASELDPRQAVEALLRDPSARPLALRLMRSGMATQPQSLWVVALTKVPGPDAAPWLEGLLDSPDPETVRHAAHALVLCDPARARAAAESRRNSRHAWRRVAALWIERQLGEGASEAALEALRCPDWHVLRYALGVVAQYGSVRDMRLVVPLLTCTFPEIRSGAWGVLEVISAHVPETIKNDLFIPCEAAAAWTPWIDAHEGASRKDLLDAALREAGYGEGLDARLRACAEGPWWLFAATEADAGHPLYWDFSPEGGLAAAARWKVSLRK